jgi:His-Xaa-Ser system radical SAM maturase HxsC
MYFNLTNFNGVKSIYSYASKIETVKKLQQDNLNVIFCTDNKCYLYPEGNYFSISSDEKKMLDMLWENDVIQFSGKRAFLYYSGESDDNVIMITGKCNSNCIMCPAAENVRKRGCTVSLSELLEIVRHIPNDSSHITITGGEPFLMGKDLFTVFEYLKNYKGEHRYLILTNGRVFCDSQYCELLSKTLPDNVHLGIPIHGYDSETHDFVTQTKGSFSQTVNGLKRLLGMGISIELRYVVSKLTMNNITRMSEFVVKELPSIGCVKIMGLEMLGNAAINFGQVWIDYKTAFESAKEGINIFIKNGIDVELYNFPLCMVDSKYWGIYRKSISGYKVRYLEACANCNEKNSCGGIFAGTVRLIKEVNPLIK